MLKNMTGKIMTWSVWTLKYQLECIFHQYNFVFQNSYTIPHNTYTISIIWTTILVITFAIFTYYILLPYLNKILNNNYKHIG